MTASSPPLATAPVPATSARAPAPTRRWPARFAVAWFAALYAVSLGVQNGGGNHPVYLLDGIRRGDPTFVPGDWVTWSTTHYHVVWGRLVAFLVRAEVLDIGLAALTIVSGLAVALALCALLRVYYGPSLLAWAATLCVLAALPPVTIGHYRLLSASVEPSGLAAAAILLGAAALARDRFLPAGLWLGVAGALHANYAALTVGVLALGTVLRGRTVARGDLFRLWIPFGLLVLPNLLLAARFAVAPDAAPAHAALIARLGHHWQPWGSAWTPPWGGGSWPAWAEPVLPLLVLGAAGCLWWGGTRLRRPSPSGMTGLLLVPTALVVGLGLAVAPLGLPGVDSLSPWRLAGFLMIAAIAAACAGLTVPDGVPRARRAAGLALMVGAAILVVVGTPGLELAMATVAVIGVAVRLAERAPARRQVVVTAALVLLSAVMLRAGLRRIGESEVAFEARDVDRRELYAWIRTATPPATVFAVPPGWDDFRLVARRPIVADFKAVPLYAPEVVAWAARLADLTGLTGPIGWAAADSAYERNLDCGRARLLQERYAVRYVVPAAGRRLACGRAAARVGPYQVVDLGAP